MSEEVKTVICTFLIKGHRHIFWSWTGRPRHWLKHADVTANLIWFLKLIFLMAMHLALTCMIKLSPYD